MRRLNTWTADAPPRSRWHAQTSRSAARLQASRNRGAQRQLRINPKTPALVVCRPSPGAGMGQTSRQISRSSRTISPMPGLARPLPALPDRRVGLRTARVWPALTAAATSFLTIIGGTRTARRSQQPETGSRPAASISAAAQYWPQSTPERSTWSGAAVAQSSCARQRQADGMPPQGHREHDTPAAGRARPPDPASTRSAAMHRLTSSRDNRASRRSRTLPASSASAGQRHRRAIAQADHRVPIGEGIPAEHNCTAHATRRSG